MSVEERSDVIFKRCLEMWGLDAQLLMLAEESSELTQASLKMLRDKAAGNPLFRLAEEIADVELMIDEVKYYFVGLDSMVSNYRREKLERLEKLLNEAEKRNV